LEVGPGRTLSTLARQHPRRTSGVPVLSCLPRPGEAGAVSALHASRARLWVLGCPVDWTACAGGERRHPVGLPTYPFERRRFWDPSPAAPRSGDRPAATPDGVSAALPQSDSDRPRLVPPSGTPEQDLAALWQELLGITRIGRDDDFFALGGDSLLATRLLTRLRRQGAELTLKDLHRAPTLRRFAAAFVAAVADGVPAGAQETHFEGEI